MLPPIGYCWERFHDLCRSAFFHTSLACTRTKTPKTACHMQILRMVHNLRANRPPRSDVGRASDGEVQVDEVSSRRRTPDLVRPASQLAAQLLLADLSAVTSTSRALNDLAASRLASALADLQAAGVDVERAVKESGS